MIKVPKMAFSRIFFELTQEKWKIEKKKRKRSSFRPLKFLKSVFSPSYWRWNPQIFICLNPSCLQSKGILQRITTTKQRKKKIQTPDYLEWTLLWVFPQWWSHKIKISCSWKLIASASGSQKGWKDVSHMQSNFRRKDPHFTLPFLSTHKK